jgi:hypothetical protein
MKVYAGITTLTDALIAQGNYAAVDAIQNILRNLDLPAIDSAEPGQLITLAGSETIEIESLSAGNYRLNAIGGGSGGIGVLTTLPTTPANGEAILALCYLPSDDGILLSPRSEDWNAVNVLCVGDYAFQQMTPRCYVASSGTYPEMDATTKKFAAYSSKFLGTGTEQLGVTNPINYQLLTGDFFIDCWFKGTAVNHNEVLLNCVDGSGGGETGWKLGFHDSDYKIGFSTHDTILVVTDSYPDFDGGNWNHLRVERYSGTLYLYLNGVIVDSAVNSTNFNHSWYLRVGWNEKLGVDIGYPWIGWIEGVRVCPGRSASNGVNFTLPTAEDEPIKKYCLVLMRGTSGNPVYEVINRMAS